jgi:hypothetical protein
LYSSADARIGTATLSPITNAKIPESIFLRLLISICLSYQFNAQAQFRLRYASAVRASLK